MLVAKLTLSFKYLGVEVKTYEANAGEGIPTHLHSFAHGTICQAGLCKITIDENSFVLANNVLYEMPANTAHEIEALENGTIIVNVVPDQAIKANA